MKQKQRQLRKGGSSKVIHSWCNTKSAFKIIFLKPAKRGGHFFPVQRGVIKGMQWQVKFISIFFFLKKNGHFRHKVSETDQCKVRWVRCAISNRGTGTKPSAVFWSLSPCHPLESLRCSQVETPCLAEDPQRHGQIATATKLRRSQWPVRPGRKATSFRFESHLWCLVSPLNAVDDLPLHPPHAQRGPKLQSYVYLLGSNFHKD